MNIKKGQITVQTFFFILMGISFIWILIFGYKQITNVNDELSEQELIQIEKDLKKTLEYCNDPLNRGSSKNFKVNSAQIDGLCILKDTKNLALIAPTINQNEINTIINSGDNLILFKDSKPIGSFFVENNFQNKCWIKGNNNSLIINFNCE